MRQPISNGTYVCFTCRLAARRSVAFGVCSFGCSRCHAPMKYLGKHWRLPKTNDNKGWKEMEDRLTQKQNKYGPNCGL